MTYAVVIFSFVRRGAYTGQDLNVIEGGPDRRRPYCRIWLVAATNGRRGRQEAGEGDGRRQPPSSVSVVGEITQPGNNDGDGVQQVRAGQ